MNTRLTLSAIVALWFAATTAAAQSPQVQGISSDDPGLPVFHATLRQRLQPSMGWTPEVRDQQAWARAGRAKARELMLLSEDSTPFEPVVVEEIDRGSYVAQRLAFNLTADSRVMALLLLPKGARKPGPAALLLHDHGAEFRIGKEKLIQPWGDAGRLALAQRWSEKYFSGRFIGDELARRGYVVLAIDALGWGDRTGPGFTREFQQALASNLFNLGSSWAGLIAQEDSRAARFLAGLPQVDRQRVAAVGFSFGAFRAWQLAAVSDDIKATVAAGWMATQRGLMVPGNNQLKGQSSFAMLHPGLPRYLDHPDVAALAAPEPLLLFAGEQDPLFPVDSVREAFAKLQAVWTAHGAADRLQTRLWPAGHVFPRDQQDAAFDWLDAQLNR